MNFIISILIFSSFAHAESLCEMIEGASSLEKIQTQFTSKLLVAQDFEKEVHAARVEVDCLERKKIILSGDAQAIRENLILMIKDTEKAAEQQDQLILSRSIDKSARPMIPVNSSEFQSHLDKIFQRYDKRGNYSSTNNNQFKFLDSGLEHRSELFETVRTAQSFLNLAYFEYYADRTGYALANALIAKKLGLSTPSEIATVARVLGTPGKIDYESPFNPPTRERLMAGVNKLKRMYLQQKLKPGKTLSESDLDGYLTETKTNVNAAFQESSDPIEVRMYLDRFKLLRARHGKSGLLEAMESVGIEVQKNLGLLFWGNTHAKITSSEKRSLIAGGNPVDKVMDIRRNEKIWRDAAILAEGSIVNQINLYAISRFYGFGEEKMIKKICDGNETCDKLNFYFPKENESRQGMNSQGRIVWTKKFETTRRLFPGVLIGRLPGTPHKRAFEEVVKNANSSIRIANGFVSDGVPSGKLIEKAKQWKLAEMKLRNGESTKVATCGPGAAAKINRRAKSILILMPRNMDLPIINVINMSLVNGMLKAGIDVCKWGGASDNEAHAGDPDRMPYSPGAMAHWKVYQADGVLSYVGSMNLNVRSSATDNEIGILTSDPAVNRDIREKLFYSDLEGSEPTKQRVINKFLLIPRLIFNYGLWMS